MKKLLEILVNTAFMFFGSKIKAVQKTILTITGVIFAVWGWFTDNSIPEVLCGIDWGFLKFFCDFEGSQVNTIILGIISILYLIVDKLKSADNLTVGNYTTPIWLDALMYVVVLSLLVYFITKVPIIAVMIIIMAVLSLVYLVYCSVIDNIDQKLEDELS